MARRRGLAALLGAVLGLAALAPAGAASAACSMGLLAEVPMHVRDGGLYLTVMVNGHQIEAELSTGNEQSFVSGWALKDLGLEQHPIDADIIDRKGTRGAFGTSAESLSLGTLKFKDSPFMVSGPAGGKVEGAPLTLGSLFIRQFDVEFDLKHNVLRLFRPKGCAGDEVLYWGGAYSVTPLLPNPNGRNDLLIAVLLNGQAVTAKLSTSVSRTHVSSGIANSVGAEVSGPARSTSTVVSKTGTFKTIAIDQEVLKNVQLDVDTLRQTFDPDMLGTRLGSHFILNEMSLGLDFLAAHRLIIANSQQKVYFTYTGGPVFAGPGAAN